MLLTLYPRLTVEWSTLTREVEEMENRAKVKVSKSERLFHVKGIVSNGRGDPTTGVLAALGLMGETRGARL